MSAGLQAPPLIGDLPNIFLAQTCGLGYKGRAGDRHNGYVGSEVTVRHESQKETWLSGNWVLRARRHQIYRQNVYRIWYKEQKCRRGGRKPQPCHHSEALRHVRMLIYTVNQRRSHSTFSPHLAALAAREALGQRVMLCFELRLLATGPKLGV